ncbi:MAG: anaerobic ribonucleoside-triphosphate reductase [Nitrososphaeria archaeon]
MYGDVIDFETLYSALGSNERLNILNELNKSGPLSYTQLKNNCGFVKKRESGRFAYHLRLLTSVNLITLNKNTKKYSLTPFGRTVLAATNELKEAALQFSGKIYVRTSKHKIEEFDSNKIYQSLIREANVPRDLASKITAEAEARISKLENVHLTAPLIREFVNSILVEKGLDEYRNKLTRLGLPVKDVTDKIVQVGLSEGNVRSLKNAAADAVFTDYLLLTQVSSEVLDMHLSGEISLVNTGCWGIMPDSVFFDALALNSFNIKFGLKDPHLPREFNKENVSFTKAVLSINKMLESVANEVCIENFIEFLQLIEKAEGELNIKRIYEFFTNSVLGINPLSGNFLTFQINMKDENRIELLKTVFEAYSLYLQKTLKSRIKLIFNIFEKENFSYMIPYIVDIIKKGGNVMFLKQPTKPISYTGIRKNFESNEIISSGTIILHSISLNLPRLAYAGSEETFLKSLIKIKLEKICDAIESRKNNLVDLMEKEILYLYEYNNDLFSKNFLSIVNLVGLDELTKIAIVGNEEEQNRLWIKFMEFSKRILEECGREKGLRILPAVYNDDSSKRFYEMDKENIPKGIIERFSGKGYSQVPVVDVKMIDDEKIVRALQSRIESTEGGYHVIVDLDMQEENNSLETIVEKIISKLDIVKIRRNMISCATCGNKSIIQTKCPRCNSARITTLRTDN